MAYQVGDKVMIKRGTMFSTLLGSSVGTVRSVDKGGWSHSYIVNFTPVGDLRLHETEVVFASSPCIVAVIIDGVAAPATRPFVHASKALATKEAERLALANPGQTFVTYEAVSRSTATKPVVSTAHGGV